MWACCALCQIGLHCAGRLRQRCRCRPSAPPAAPAAAAAATAQRRARRVQKGSSRRERVERVLQAGLRGRCCCCCCCCAVHWHGVPGAQVQRRRPAAAAPPCRGSRHARLLPAPRLYERHCAQRLVPRDGLLAVQAPPAAGQRCRGAERAASGGAGAPLAQLQAAVQRLLRQRQPPAQRLGVKLWRGRCRRSGRRG